MTPDKYFVLTFILIVGMSSERIKSMPESKQPYVSSLVSMPVQTRSPVLSDMWRHLLSNIQYIYEICSETYQNDWKGTAETVIRSFASCGRVEFACGYPHFKRCMTKQVITVNELFHVNITFLSFNLSHSRGCRLQSLLVSCQTGNQFFTKHLCGNRLPWSEYPLSNECNITMFNNSKMAIQAKVVGVFEVLEPGEVSESHHVEIFSTYVVNATVSHPFTGDGVTKVRGFDTQTFHIQGKLSCRIGLSAFHDHIGDAVLSDISGYEGPSSYSKPMSKTTIFRNVSHRFLDNDKRMLTVSECESTDNLPWETKFQPTKGFHMIVRVTGDQLTGYCSGNTRVKLVYESIEVDPVYITVSTIPL